MCIAQAKDKALANTQVDTQGGIPQADLPPFSGSWDGLDTVDDTANLHLGCWPLYPALAATLSSYFWLSYKRQKKTKKKDCLHGASWFSPQPLVKEPNFKLVPDNEVFKLHRSRGREGLAGLSVHASDVPRASLREDVVSSWPNASSSLATKQMKSQLVVTAAIPCLGLGGP